MASDDRLAAGTLTRLFVRRLLDNDLISPHADRHESLAVLYAGIVSVPIFLTFFLSTDYLAAFIQLPGPTSLSALSDHFLLIALSLGITALGGLLIWDSLMLEPRDAAILGPLPVRARTLTRAKLAAVSMFGAASALAVNAVPAVLYPLLLTLNLRGIGSRRVLQLMTAHATSVVLAGLLGFFGVLAARGLLQLLVGRRRHRLVSAVVQALGVVYVVTGLLLAPAVRSAQVRDWIAGRLAPSRAAHLVLWYLAMNEVMGGHVVADTPVVLPPGIALPPTLKARNDAAQAAYHRLTPRFHVFAAGAWSSALAVVFAVAAFLWNNRRLPDRPAATPADWPAARFARLAARRLTDGNPEAQAGFFFTLCALSRSATHRMIVALAAAAALTHLLMTLNLNRVPTVQPGPLPLGLYAITYVTLISLVVGLRYAVTIPAELSSNWTIRLAWRGDERAFLAGTKRAAFSVLLMVSLFALLPFNLFIFGIAVAIERAAVSVVFAFAALEAVFLSYRNVPFACGHVPLQNPKLVWPAGFATIVLAAYGCAVIERLAFRTAIGGLTYLLALGAVAWAITLVDHVHRRERRDVNFDGKPAPATQRLGLFDRFTAND